MLEILANPTFRKLFAAQVVALLGTGLATVALALLAFELAGDKAGAVLGTALAIKMIAYVGVAPVAAALAERVPRRALLVGLDAVRAAIVLVLPFVDQVWQIYLLIFLLQSASAAFTPAFQATIPDVLPDERAYTRALSLSRLAYELESLASPVIAAALLWFIGFHWLFGGTAIGFALSAALVLSATLPRLTPPDRTQAFSTRVTRGVRIYLATPRLRGLLALNLVAAAGGAMVFVNTVAIVQAIMARPAGDVALALAAFGAGSMLAALTLPRLLDRLADRSVMLAGAVGLLALLLAAAALQPLAFAALLALWFAKGIAYAAIVTPSGRLLRRSAHQEDRPAVFAAQFALSHAMWLVAYPVAGWVGAEAGMVEAFLVLAALALVGTATALRIWPAGDLEVVPHDHSDLPPDHPHLLEHGRGHRHAHVFIIDEHHRHWPA